MPQRKKIRIPAIKTSIYDIIVSELQKNPELVSDYDMESIEIIIKKKKAPPRILNVEKAIGNLNRYILINKNNIEIVSGEPIVLKKDIVKMLKISRPTLDKWIKDGFITPVKSKHFRNIEIFPPELVLEQLTKQKKNK